MKNTLKICMRIITFWSPVIVNLLLVFTFARFLHQESSYVNIGLFFWISLWLLLGLWHRLKELKHRRNRMQMHSIHNELSNLLRNLHQLDDDSEHVHQREVKLN